MPRPLNCFHHHALMTRAGTRDSTWNDLPALGNELGPEPPQYHLFVIDKCRFIHAEHADFATWFTKLAWLTARFTG